MSGCRLDVAPPDRHQAAVQFIFKGMRPTVGFDLMPSHHEAVCVVCTRAADYARLKGQADASPGTGLETELASSKESLKRAVGAYQRYGLGCGPYSDKSAEPID
jgi:hypothetical protein